MSFALTRSRYLLLTLNTCLFLACLAILIFMPAPRIERAFGGATVEIYADRAWTILPGDCAMVSWRLEGIQSVYVNGAGKVGADQLDFCPASGERSLSFEILAGDGQLQIVEVPIHSLSLYALTCLILLAFALPFAVAVWHLISLRISEPIALRWEVALALLALLPLGVMIQVAQPSLATSFAERLGDIFTSRAWHGLGSALASLVYIPLTIQMLRRGGGAKRAHDLAAIAAFFAVLLPLFAQAGFESIGQWESWPLQAYFEGRPSKAESELISRYWALVPHVLSASISWHTFAGYHLVNFAMFWGMLALFYGILRQLGLAAWLAFLAALLLLVYPVNSSLMSLRSLPMTFSKLALLAAVLWALDCRGHCNRLGLLGIWLALLLSLGASEYGFVIILLVPVLWWRGRLDFWQKLNLTVIWLLAPIAKLAHLQLLNAAGVNYYGAWSFAPPAGKANLLEVFGYYLDVVGNAILRVYAYGWQEALESLAANVWLAPTAISLGLMTLAAAWLARDASEQDWPTRAQLRTALLGGFVFLLPAIGVVMWVARRAFGLWRMYVYAPVGASIAVLMLVLLAASAVRSWRLRKAIVIAACLLLILPGLSRLYVQQDAFARSANAKAQVLWQIIEQAPYFQPEARLIVLTSMSSQDMRYRGLKELHSNMLDSAIYMLYQNGRPRVAALCMLSENCGSSDIAISANWLKEAEDFADVVFFRLHDDLRTELLLALPPELADRASASYDPKRLIDFSAPMPPRALTMLASARELAKG